jgi:hypothetical protein
LFNTITLISKGTWRRGRDEEVKELNEIMVYFFTKEFD